MYTHAEKKLARSWSARTATPVASTTEAYQHVRTVTVDLELPPTPAYAVNLIPARQNLFGSRYLIMPWSSVGVSWIYHGILVVSELLGLKRDRMHQGLKFTSW